MVLGRGASPITFRAGRAVGLKTEAPRTSSDIEKALELLSDRLLSHGIVWPFRIYRRDGQDGAFYEKAGGTAVQLVFSHCMVRCALFRYGHEQRRSLCMMNHGLFCGHLQRILGTKADLEILHAGENACLKELLISQ
jgi:predicted hydrocarbon binding protein